MMMKTMLRVLIVVSFILLLLSGCQGAHVEGVSVGVMYFEADLGYQEIKELVPFGAVNIKFGEKGK